MTDSLRDRIAAVLLDHWPVPVFRTAKRDAHIERIADAVIATLGLTKVTRTQNPPIHRYVTEWEADNNV